MEHFQIEKGLQIMYPAAISIEHFMNKIKILQKIAVSTLLY